MAGDLGYVQAIVFQVVKLKIESIKDLGVTTVKIAYFEI